MSDLDDLLGSSETPAPYIPRRRFSSAADSERISRDPLAAQPKPELPDDEHEALHVMLQEDGTPPVATLKRPMTLTAIAELLGKEPRRVSGRLKHCPIVGYTKNRDRQIPLYDLVVAIDYLANPTANAIETWFRAQSTATLPPMLSKAMWEGIHTRNKVMKESGELWHTADIQRVLANAAMTITESVDLWVERLPGVEQMTTEQYASFRKQAQNLKAEIYRLMIEDPRDGVESVRADLETMMEETVAAEGDNG